ncbi:MAG TPA: iron-sulfur cluster insertion protein ErpA [Alphaproteobacteria bacterium]|jgi:iron-sulfur cluster insertion protein|nr:iron-sulfur cluster insertion protein ErpA [Alphaproteobacteria bacterium]
MAEQDTLERSIGLTENAARRIAALQQEAQNKGQMLRVAVSGGGCQGYQYSFSFDAAKNDDDFVFQRDGASVVVDEVSLGLLAGSELDFVEDLVGSYFAVKNPNAKSSCGCGSSFSTV